MTEQLKPGEWIDEMAEVPPDAWPQPEALRLADELDADPMVIGYEQHAAELRRLHSVNAQLLEALEEYSLPIDINNITLSCIEFGNDAVERELQRRAAIAAAKGGA